MPQGLRAEGLLPGAHSSSRLRRTCRAARPACQPIVWRPLQPLSSTQGPLSGDLCSLLVHSSLAQPLPRILHNIFQPALTLQYAHGLAQCAKSHAAMSHATLSSITEDAAKGRKPGCMLHLLLPAQLAHELAGGRGERRRQAAVLPLQRVHAARRAQRRLRHTHAGTRVGMVTGCLTRLHL